MSCPGVASFLVTDLDDLFGTVHLCAPHFRAPHHHHHIIIIPDRYYSLLPFSFPFLSREKTPPTSVLPPLLLLLLLLLLLPPFCADKQQCQYNIPLSFIYRAVTTVIRSLISYHLCCLRPSRFHCSLVHHSPTIILSIPPAPSSQP